MKKSGLVFLIFIDVLLMSASGAFLYFHVSGGSNALSKYGNMMSRVPSAAPIPPQPAAVAPLVAASTVPAAGQLAPMAKDTVTPAEATPGMRKILFSYRNPKAQQAAIRADFTGWKAEPMHRDPRNPDNWIYQANLTPGEYAYCFTVDDKTFKDPANKHTKQIGRTFVSAIDVKPMDVKPSN